MRGRVRQPRRQASGRPRRPPEEGEARRGVDLARDARDPPRAARGRRQLHRRPRLRRPRPREGARRGGPEEPDAGPAGREGRARGADGADGGGRVGARLREVHGDPARRPPGLGQDDGLSEARARTPQAGPQAGPRRRRPAAPSRDRPARAARQADPGAGLPHRHQGRGRGDAERHRARARRRPRHGDRRHRGPPADRRRADGGARPRPRRGEAAQHPARARRDDRPGGRERRAGLQRADLRSTA